MILKDFRDFNITNQKVILRVDYNVPLNGGKIGDLTRIKESLSTIKELLQAKNSIIIISHLGRPDGKVNPSYSLKPVAAALGKMLKTKIKFFNDCLSTEAENYSQNLKAGEVIMLENLRFYADEENNNSDFAKKLSKLGTVFINDAFGTAHRAHASTVGITQFLPSYAGTLMQKEVNNLSQALNFQNHPITLIVGGAKIDTKIDIINSFIDKADNFIFGGGIANTFLASQDYYLADSLVELDKVEVAKNIYSNLQSKQKKILLPLYSVVASTIDDKAKTKDISSTNLVSKDKILDIGKETAKYVTKFIEQSKLIVWNGPMGVYEFKPFRSGTKAIAKAVMKATKHGAISILGGGDTLDALNKLKIKHSKFTHVSTGGGAMLEFLEKGTLPGLEPLKFT